VSYFMPLQHLTPAEAVPILQQAVPPHPYGVYVPVPNAQAIIITENSSVIRQLVALQELIDVPPTKMISQFVTSPGFPNPTRIFTAYFKLRNYCARAALTTAIF
ncbi:MAG TPA: hypothetical protein PKZ53_19995, partial [Acidobacteriota bacterium]|nr:hypothetical protein [Acidobacteriota bacterium]